MELACVDHATIDLLLGVWPHVSKPFHSIPAETPPSTPLHSTPPNTHTSPKVSKYCLDIEVRSLQINHQSTCLEWDSVQLLPQCCHQRAVPSRVQCSPGVWPTEGSDTAPGLWWEWRAYHSLISHISFCWHPANRGVNVDYKKYTSMLMLWALAWGRMMWVTPTGYQSHLK